MTSQETRIREAVKERYASLATEGCGCETGTSGCCSATVDVDVPEEAVRLGAGCGNPVDTASINQGNVVLDLGSGAGGDAFRASKLVGFEGKVIGVDSTPEMVWKAREIAAKNGYGNVEFRLGEIEHLPVESNSVDMAISNCVLNLLPDKLLGFREIYRVLKPGGRIRISDLTTKGPKKHSATSDMSSWAACVEGAIPKDEYLELLTRAGFRELDAVDAGRSQGLLSVTITGAKPHLV
ncbi:MAG TPA: methyltransferase domain-containing protein [Candidatus Bathyarchaeia archaeon]|nr:methyltransferase domain-containing protein [Candidatus Bathyarchaeia archaeon]